MTVTEASKLREKISLLAKRRDDIGDLAKAVIALNETLLKHADHLAVIEGKPKRRGQ